MSTFNKHEGRYFCTGPIVSQLMSDLSSLLIIVCPRFDWQVCQLGWRGRTMGIMTVDALCDNNDIIVPSSLFSCHHTTLCYYACQTFQQFGKLFLIDLARIMSQVGWSLQGKYDLYFKHIKPPSLFTIRRWKIVVKLVIVIGNFTPR